MPEQDGVMVAFYVPAVDASALALDDGHSPETLHLTLAYLGETEQVPALDKLPAMVGEWAQTQEPITGQVNGVGRFCVTNDAEGRDAFYAVYDSAALPQFRQALVDHLATQGITLEGSHGFVPHITLSYIPPDTPSPLERIDPIPITFDTVAVAVGEKRHDYPLGVSAQEVISNEGGEIVLYSKDRSKVLGRYPYGKGKRFKNAKTARAAAEERERQVQAFKHMEGVGTMDWPAAYAAYQEPSELWLTVREMRDLCPECAEEMQRRGLERVNVVRLSEEGLGKAKRGFFSRCMSYDFGSQMSDKKAFCAWLKHRVTGSWPGEGEALQMADDGRTSEIVTAEFWPVVEAEGQFRGRKWDVTIIGANSPAEVVRRGDQEYVVSQNGRLYSCAALEASVPLWDGVKVYDNHLTDNEFEDRQGMRSVAQEWIGSIVRPNWDKARRQLRGVFEVVDEALAEKLLNAHRSNVLHTIGLSIDTMPETRGIWHEGAPLTVIEGFKKIFSVDLVAEPAAGGRFNRLLASVSASRAIQEGEIEWTDELQAEVLEFVKVETRAAIVEAVGALARNGRGRQMEQADPERVKQTLVNNATQVYGECDEAVGGITGLYAEATRNGRVLFGGDRNYQAAVQKLNMAQRAGDSLVGALEAAARFFNAL